MNSIQPGFYWRSGCQLHLKLNTWFCSSLFTVLLNQTFVRLHFWQSVYVYMFYIYTVHCTVLYRFTIVTYYNIVAYYNCTDEISISDVNSYKSSLVIIYMCLKKYCHKYVANFNFISIHVAQVWLSNVPPRPSPCLSYSF